MMLYMCSRIRERWDFIAVIALLLTVIVVPADAQYMRYDGTTPPAKAADKRVDETLEKVTWTQNLNAPVPQELSFVDETGRTVQLKKYFNDKPVVIVMIYFYCPMICGEVLSQSFRTMEEINFRPGKDYEFIAVSINPNEGPDLALQNKQGYLKRYALEENAEGVHFLTTKNEQDIKALAKAIGFGYTFVEKTGEYAHPGGMVLSTPDGHIARYLSGLFFEPRDLKFGLLEAGKGNIGSPVELLIKACFHFNDDAGRYTFAVKSVLRLFGVLTVFVGSLLIIGMFRREKKRNVAAEVKDENF